MLTKRILQDIQIPGYQIGRQLGEGGMAHVYLATQESLQRQVAIKLLSHPETPTFTERFLNEGSIIASLNHRNIVTIYDIGVVNGVHYIPMEYVEGGDLGARIRAGMQEREALQIVEKIGDALHAVHSKGVIHRDVKPANILFHRNGSPLLTDFGIAKQTDADIDLTVTGTAIGTPEYFSPEQGQDLPIDGRADIYSLGVIFFEMLVGHVPFRGPSPVETVVAHVRAPIPVLPEELSRYQPLLERMLAKKAEDRFADAGELVACAGKLHRRRRIERVFPEQEKKTPEVLPPSSPWAFNAWAWCSWALLCFLMLSWGFFLL